MRDRFKDVESADINLAPMFDYFNSLANHEFVKVIRYFSKGFGYGDEYYLCQFPTSKEPWEEGYFENGVRFTVGIGYNKESSCIVDDVTFYKYLKLACEDYLKEHIEEEVVVNEILLVIKSRHGIKE